MPITSIKGLRSVTEISDITHTDQSGELNERCARIDFVDRAIYESEQENAHGTKAIDAEIVFAELEKKYFG